MQSENRRGNDSLEAKTSWTDNSHGDAQLPASTVTRGAVDTFEWEDLK